jgi:hypothetical protein
VGLFSTPLGLGPRYYSSICYKGHLDLLRAAQVVANELPENFAPRQGSVSKTSVSEIKGRGRGRKAETTARALLLVS